MPWQGPLRTGTRWRETGPPADIFGKVRSRSGQNPREDWNARVNYFLNPKLGAGLACNVGVGPLLHVAYDVGPAAPPDCQSF